MGMIPAEALPGLEELNRQLWAEVSASRAWSQPMKTMLYMHLKGPWIPGNLAVVISPLGSDLVNFVTKPVFSLDGLAFYYPSIRFWEAHGEIAHPPQGAGCDLLAHVNFLTQAAPDPAFVYGVVTRDRNVRIETPAAFEEECLFFRAGLGE